MIRPMIVLVLPPGPESPLIHDMAGGLGCRGGDFAILPPLDLLYWATSLTPSADIRVIDALSDGRDLESFLTSLFKLDPDYVILTIGLPSLVSDVQAFLAVRSRLLKSILVVKTSITYPPVLKEIIESAKPDICVVGECDLTIADILFNGRKDGTAEIIGDQLVIHPENVLKDLDLLPIPRRDFLNKDIYFYNLLDQPTTIMQTSRGCSYPCDYYCPYPLTQGKGWRSRSADHIVEEIRYVIRQENIRNILFRDAVFTFDRRRILELCKAIHENHIEFNWWCETRVDKLDFDLMEAMKAAGCCGINIGVETGDAGLLPKIAKPGLTIEKLRRLQSIANKIGIKLQYLILVGLPGENRETVKNTFELICELKPHSIGISLATPYPGTHFYEDALQKGWIVDSHWSYFDTNHAVLTFPSMPSNDLLLARRVLYKGFHLATSPVSDASNELSKLREQLMSWASSGSDLAI